MIYVDNAATTMLEPKVLEKMMPYLTEFYGNASSIYRFGQEAKEVVSESRETIAKCLNADVKEIYFTSGGTEADNWAIKGVADALSKKGNHIITSAIEHHAILHTCEFLEKHGYEVTYLPVDENGLVNPDDLENAITDKTILVSIMFANNEIGTIQPIKKLAEIAHNHGVYFHTDAVQAVAHVEIDVKDLGIDLLSMSAHKFGGPKGIGALYIKKGVRVTNLLHGGQQELGRRATTENLAGIVGMAAALKLAMDNFEENTKKMKALRERYINLVLEKIPYCRLNGHRTERLPGNTNISFQFIEGEAMLLLLDMYGIAASSGSACTSGSLDPSHVLLAIGLPHGIAHGSLRVTFSHHNTEEEVDQIVEALEKTIQRLRDMSPLYEKVRKGE
ncbi:MAG: cysteine desulfurase NifS [Clostridia bacterium]|nr:cysteine desulfurase NifS [Clostridia bacterium]